MTIISFVGSYENELYEPKALLEGHISWRHLKLYQPRDISSVEAWSNSCQAASGPTGEESESRSDVKSKKLAKAIGFIWGYKLHFFSHHGVISLPEGENNRD